MLTARRLRTPDSRRPGNRNPVGTGVGQFFCRGGRQLVCSLLLAIALNAPVHAQTRQDITDPLDQFAVTHLEKLQPLSISHQVEYCGLFGMDGDGRFVATRAKRGGPDSCVPDPPKRDIQIIASYHTHGSYDRDADTEVPSFDDLLADMEEGIDGYIATPGGRVWVNYVDAEITFILCGPGCIYADPSFVECNAFLPQDTYMLEEIDQRFEDDTGIC